jgi:hypothetical protein
MNPLGMSQPVGLDVLQRLATGYTREERELLKRQQAAQRQQMDTGYRARTPGYNAYASQAAREMVPMAAGAFPVLGEAVDASMGARALQEGRYGDAALHGAGLALPFASGPMLNAGLGMAAGAGILAGKGAKTADLHALSLAEQMAEQGENAGKIWEETGWWVPTPNGPMPPGGAPRYEIPDPLPHVPLKRVTGSDTAAAARYRHTAEVMEEAARLREFAMDHNIDMSQVLKRLQELGVDTPSEEVIKEAMLRRHQGPAVIRARAQTYTEMAEKEAMKSGRLGERYPHQALYEAYPELKDFKVELVDASAIGGARGQLDPFTKTIRLDRNLSEEEMPSVLLHEAQHGVQDIEPGFSKGGTTEAAASRVEAATTGAVIWRARLNRMIKAEEEALKNPDLPKEQVARLQRNLATHKQKLAEFNLSNPPVPSEVKEVWADMPPFQQYKHLGGEAEARMVQNRQTYDTPEQKRKIYPWTTFGGLDVPLEYLIP